MEINKKYLKALPHKDSNKVLDVIAKGNYESLECVYVDNSGNFFLSLYDKENGSELFYYCFGNDYIEYFVERQKAPITEDVKSIIVDCCKRYEERVSYCKDNYTYVEHLKVKFYYKKNEDAIAYDFLIVEDMLGKRYAIAQEYDFDAIIRDCRYDCLDNDPIYVAAKKNNDRELELRMKDMYCGLTKEEENEMTQITGIRYIRRKEHSKLFGVIGYLKVFNFDTQTLTEEENKILCNSGIVLSRTIFPKKVEERCFSKPASSIFKVNKLSDGVRIVPPISFKELLETL